MDKEPLADKQKCVVLNDSGSQWVNVTSGVPLRSMLGPLLFILCVNDITDIDSKVHWR